MIDLSIIIPVFNVEEYIADCLESLINQEYDSFEILVVNDGSKDRSIHIAEQYQKRSDKIRILHKENGGLSSARNYGLQFARGNYVWFVDSDDYIRENVLGNLLKKINGRDIDAVCFNAYNHFPDGSTKLVRKNLQQQDELFKGIELFQLFLRRKAYIQAVWSFIYRRDFLQRNSISFVEDLIHEDEPYTAIVLTKAERVTFFNEAIYFHRIRSGSIMTQTLTDKQINDVFIIIDFLQKLSGLYPEYRTVYKFRIFCIVVVLLYRVNGTEFKSVTVKRIMKLDSFNILFSNIPAFKEKLEYLLVWLKLHILLFRMNILKQNL